MLKKYLTTRVICLILFLFFACFTYLAFMKHSMSWYFQDETDHVAVGWMMNHFNKQLYIDLSTNHQPLPVLVGAAIEKVINYVTLYQLISRVRLIMFLFTTAVAAVFVFRFGKKALLASVMIYSLSYYYFGFHVLAESLVIFTVVLILGLNIEYLADSVYQRKKTPTLLFFDSILFGLCAFWTMFNLLTAWPFVCLSLFIYLYYLPKPHKLLALLSFILPTAILFSYISLPAWYEETIYNLIHFFIPSETSNNSFRYLLLPILPFISFIKFYDPLAVPIIYLITVLLVIYKKVRKVFVSKKHLIIMILIVMSVYSLNSRVVKIPVAFFDGFHYWPFLAGLSCFTFFVIYHFARQKMNQIFHIGLFLVLIVNTSWWREKKDRLTEHNIQYGSFQLYADSINRIKSENETLFAGANGAGYLNMAAGIPFSGRQNFHLDWEWQSPKLRQEFWDLMKSNPPTYVYFLFDESGYASAMKEILTRDYTQLYNVNKDGTDFFISNKKLEQLDEEQLKKLKGDYFFFPNEK